jgi:hypothetical protein
VLNYCIIFTENNEDLIGAAGGDLADSVAPSHRLLHDASEPIMPRSQDLIEGSEKTAKVRKIAAGPAAPSYKGKGHDLIILTFVMVKVVKTYFLLKWRINFNYIVHLNCEGFSI